MKKRIFLYLIVMFLVPNMSFASGTQDILPKEIQALVKEAECFEDYVLLTADRDTLQGHPVDLSIFVLTKGDCCVLFVTREVDGEWILESYTRKGVYPKREQNESLQISKIDAERFEMSWPEEVYRFYVRGTSRYSWLYQAEFQTANGICIAEREDGGTGILFTCDGASIRWNLDENKQQTWRNFNPSLFPKNIETVNRINELMEKLPESVSWGILIETTQLKRKTLLYNCPNKDSIQLDTSTLFLQETFSYYGNINDGWYVISYQEGVERATFGYIQKSDFPLSEREQQITRFSFYNVPLVAATNTWLTDDPFLSQECYKEIPVGARMTGLDGFDANYVYVEVAIDGEVIRGFVPMQDLRSE